MNLLLVKHLQLALGCADIDLNQKTLIEYFPTGNNYSVIVKQELCRIHLVMDASSGLFTVCYFTFTDGSSVSIHSSVSPDSPIRVLFSSGFNSCFAARSKEVATKTLQQHWSHMSNLKLMQYCIDVSA